MYVYMHALYRITGSCRIESLKKADVAIYYLLKRIFRNTERLVAINSVKCK